MTTLRPDDDATRVIPAVLDADHTQVIPPVRSANRSRPPGPNLDLDQTAVIPAVMPARPNAASTDATAVIPAIRPDRPNQPDRLGDPRASTNALTDVDRRAGTDDLDWFTDLDDPDAVPPGRTRAYDSEPGAEGYRGRHSDIIPLTEGSPIRKVIRTVGEIMITCGLVLLLFAGYEIWGKAAIVSSHQADLDAQLDQSWGADDPSVMAPPEAGPSGSPTQAAPPPVPPGGSLGRLYLPRLGKYWVVVEGVEPQDIAYAPGHYPNTAAPGEVGNFSVAGHRSPAIFWDLDKMQPGDPIVVETRTMFFVYHVTGTEIVAPTAIQVVAPVPDQPGVAPTEAMLTLTTCNPRWDNYQRLIVHAKLDPHRSQPRSAGRPAEIGG